MRLKIITDSGSKVANWLFIAAYVLISLAGCSRKEAAPKASQKFVAPPHGDANLLLSLTFAGTRTMMADTNTAYLTNLVALPETTGLKQRIVERFSCLPERLVNQGMDTKHSPAPKGTSNATQMLEPIFAELFEAGFSLELRGESNVVGAAELTAKTSTERIQRWNESLVNVAREWFGEEPTRMPHGWKAGNGRLEFNAIDSSVTIRIAREPGSHAGELSSTANIEATLPPAPLKLLVAATEEGQILKAKVKSSLLPQSIRGSLYGRFDYLEFKVFAEEMCLKTIGHLTYSIDLPGMMIPIVVPSDIFNETPVSFTVLRNTEGWLPPDSALRQFLPDPIPEPLFFWGGDGSPFQFFTAMPFQGQGQFYTGFAPKLATTLSNLVEGMDIGQLMLDSNETALAWRNIGFVSPKLSETHSTTSGQNFLVSELMPRSPIADPFPTMLVEHVNGQTNLLFYDWELTGIRMQCWLQLSQLMLFLTHHQQLGEETPTLKWLLAAIRSFPMTSSTVSEVVQTGSHELSIARRAPLGLTSAEMFWLANWLESSNFPNANFLMPTPQPGRGTGH